MTLWHVRGALYFLARAGESPVTKTRLAHLRTYYLLIESSDEQDHSGDATVGASAIMRYG